MNLDSGYIYFMGSIHELSNYRQLLMGMNAHCISPFNENTSPACAFDAASIQMNSIGFFASKTYGLTLDEELIDELEAIFAKALFKTAEKGVGRGLHKKVKND